ncbi:MAG: YicC family protein [Alphaproteobacteria bacterium]|nr:YicC family protein [Alphaproteobacteria bacterium]MCB9928640.1 YicC family protein [Alphaproteobacteria bacterium]
MTIHSMTGFARSQGSLDDLQWVWELRSVNNRGLDLRLRLPSGFEALDQPVRKLASGQFARGSIAINLQVQWTRKRVAYQLNEEWLATLQKRASDMTEGHHTAIFDQIRPEGLLALRGVIEAVEDTQTPTLEAAAQSELLAGARIAVDALASARADEGRALHAVLASHFDTIERLTGAARATAATQPQAIQARITRAVADLVSSTPALSEDRIAQEVALLATKADVREELDRLTAHVEAGRDLVARGEPCGRKLEFLAQEFNREANTLCSKSQDIDLTRIGLDLKATIDQLREQVANVE